MKAMVRGAWAASGALAIALTGCQTGGSGGHGTSSASTSGVAAACSSSAAPQFSGTSTAFDAPANVEGKDAVAVQVSAPAMTTYRSGKKGYRVAKVHLGLQVNTNGVFAISPRSVVLADAEGNVCPRPTSDPLPKAFSALQVDETHPRAGDVAFLVPEHADLSKYTVFYLDKPQNHRAAAHWSQHGTTPTVPVATTCAGGTSTFSTKGAHHVTYGHSRTFGDDTVSLKITVHTPHQRELKPSEKQPNDVEGIAVKVTGSAKGALGFIGRNQFRLVDNTGHLCKYNPLGSTGETLSSALIKADKSKSYTLIFWMPKGAKVNDFTMLYFADPHSKKVSAYWTLSKAAKEKLKQTGESKASGH